MIKTTTLALCAALLLAVGAAEAVTPAEKCQAGKLKVAGKYDFCRLKAEAKAATTGGMPDYAKCDAKYTDKWGSTEAAGGGMCPSNGDQAAIQAFITQHTDDLAVALAGGALPDCPGDLGTCNADLATCSTSLATCNTNLTATAASLTTCNANLTTCNTNLGAALACGNGAIDGGEQCDQANLNGATCVTQGFAGGTLKCGNGCGFDTSACWAARFADNANGTISDNQTGLKWEKKVKLDGATNFVNPRDADNYYRWAGTCSILTSKYCQPTAAAAALCAANSENGTTGCDQCGGGEGTCNAATTAWTLAADANTASVGGHTDWRVPNRTELVSIVDYADTTYNPVTYAAFQGASCGGACTDITNPACSCTQTGNYWSASSLAPNPPSVWVVNFFNGDVNGDGKTLNFYVRLVRGGS